MSIIVLGWHVLQSWPRADAMSSEFVDDYRFLYQLLTCDMMDRLFVVPGPALEERELGRVRKGSGRTAGRKRNSDAEIFRHHFFYIC